MIAPSTRKCGVVSSRGMSLQVPGSDSSALITRYFGLADVRSMNDHLVPVGNPAPPRPRRPDSLTSAITSSGVMDNALRRP